MTTPLPSGWESDILNALGAPVTPNNVASLDVWQRVEGGSTGNPDSYNPFNTTLPFGGSHGTNSVNVQAFPDWSSGLHATVQTIEQSNMRPIWDALKGNVATPQFETAVNGTPWGTHFTGGEQVPNGAGTGTGGGGGGGFNVPSPGDIVGGIGDVISGTGIPNPLDVLNPANWLEEALKAFITNGFVLRGTLMLAGLIILFIGLSQISKGDQTAAQTAGGGVSRVTVHVKQAGKSARQSAGHAAEGAAA